jgi:hypothetical protein
MADIDKALSMIPGKHKKTFMPAMLFLLKGNLQTEINWSQNIFQNGLSLRKKEIWQLILTLPIFLMIW